MSLKDLAQQVRAEGRGDDTVLIHMTPREVNGLQALAKAGGGSLTVNPKTGLPEAGFLDNLLPTLLGVGLSFVPGVGPLAAAGIVGGGTALASGDLSKGIMAGLGAYGGAGLGAGLAGSGAAAAQDFAMQGVQSATTQGAIGQGLQGALAPTMTAGTVTPYTLAAQPAAAGLSAPALGPGLELAAAQSATPALGAGYDLMAPIAEMPTAAVNPGAANEAAAAATRAYQDLPWYDQASAGIKGLATEPGRAAFMQNIGGTSGLMKAGYGIAAPVLAGMQPTTPAPQEDDTERMRYEYRPGYTGGLQDHGSAMTSERTYFRPEFVRMADGGSTDDKLSGASREAYEYLMGRSAASPVTTAAVDRAAAIAAPAAPAPAAAPAAPAATTQSRFDPFRSRNFKMTGGYQQPAGATDDAGQMAGITGLLAPKADERPRYRYEQSSGRYVQLAEGGMAKGGFVIPADVVSALGNGSTDAGLRALAQRLGDVKPIKGPGDGLSDSIPTSIEGKQPARVADGEAYVPPETVKRIGGAKKLYAMMEKVRRAAHGKSTQQRPVNPKAVV